MQSIDPNSWSYHPDFADLIVSKDSQSALQLLVTADIALGFARALVARKYDEAAGMLATSLKSVCSPDDLRKQLEEMIWLEGDESRWPTGIQVVAAADRSVLKDWKRSDPSDFGWAYVAVTGSDYCEAVAVMIAKDDQRLAIREIEWGRP